MKKIKFKGIKDVKSPERDGRNAGYDFFVPKFTEEFLKDLFNQNVYYFCDLIKSHNGIDAAYHKFITQHIHQDENGLKYIVIEPIQMRANETMHYNIKVPAGLQYCMEDSNDSSYTYMLKNTNKSGVASKNSVIAGACAMDMEYRNEIIINLIGFKPLVLKEDSKMIQAIIHRVEIPEIDFVPYGDDRDIFDDTLVDRGGGFNSTGKGL